MARWFQSNHWAFALNAAVQQAVQVQPQLKWNEIEAHIVLVWVKCEVTSTNADNGNHRSS